MLPKGITILQLAFLSALTLACAYGERFDERSLSRSSAVGKTRQSGHNDMKPVARNQNPQYVRRRRYLSRRRRTQRRRALKRTRKSLRKKVRRAIREYRSSGRGGGVYLAKAKLGESGPVPSVDVKCTSTQYLSVTEAQALAEDSIGHRIRTEVPKCNTSVVDVEFGSACQTPAMKHLGALYDSGVCYMALGATVHEAFAPFIHARAVAWNTQVCFPSYRRLGKIIIPDAYTFVYDIFVSKLVARLRQRAELKGSVLPDLSTEDIGYILRNVQPERDSSLRKTVEDTMTDVHEFPTMKKMCQIMNRLPRPSLSTVLPRTPAESLQSSGGDSSLGSQKPPAQRAQAQSAERFFVSPQMTTAYKNEASLLGDRMTEGDCNRHNDPKISAQAFKVFKPPFAQLESKYEVCCARECFLLAVVQRSRTHLSNCCQVSSASLFCSRSYS